MAGQPRQWFGRDADRLDLCVIDGCFGQPAGRWIKCFGKLFRAAFILQLGSGINYFTEGTPAPYTGNALIDNAPTPAEMLALNVSTTNTVTFGQALINPIMAIVSMGQLGLPVSYDFDAPFTVLSEGRGYWGDGWYETFDGDILKGYELHAAIQFGETLDSISWTNSPNEYWHGFTFGIPAESAPVPEPGTLLLLAAGLIGLGVCRKNCTENLVRAGFSSGSAGCTPAFLVCVGNLSKRRDILHSSIWDIRRLIRF